MGSHLSVVSSTKPKHQNGRPSLLKKLLWFSSKKSSKKSVSNLPSDMILQAFLKMDNFTLCRFRQTCRFMDSVAETHKTTLAARNHSGFMMGISGAKTMKQIGFVFVAISGLQTVFERWTFSVDSKYAKKISAISIKTLCIIGDHRVASPEGITKIKEIVLELQNFPFKLRFVDFPSEEIVEICDSIATSQSTISVEFYRSPIDLKILEKAKNREKLWIKIDMHSDFIDYFERTQHFYGFTTRLTDGHAFDDIMDNLSKKNAGNLRHLVFYIDKKASVNFGEHSINSPPLSVLWREEPISVVEKIETPNVIYKMELPSEEDCAIISCYQIPLDLIEGTQKTTFWKYNMGYFRCFGVFIVRNKPWNVLNCVAKNLGITKIDPILREQFANADEHSKCDVIQKIYVENDVYLTPLDYLNSVDDDFGHCLA